MALVECKEWGNAVSTNAVACPKCGAPTFAGRLTAFTDSISKIGFGSIVVISVVAVVLWNKIFPDNPPTTEHSQPVATSANTKQHPQTQELSLSERYPGPWREEFNPSITKALAAKRVGGCGQYKYRKSTKDGEEYLVYCTADGRNWSAYLVWPAIEEVTGPHLPDPTLR